MFTSPVSLVVAIIVFTFVFPDEIKILFFVVISSSSAIISAFVKLIAFDESNLASPKLPKVTVLRIISPV